MPEKFAFLGAPKNSIVSIGTYGCIRGKENKHFFREVLEPLFYTALNSERPDDFYKPLNTRIPFLNGGLFEELDGYDWRNSDLQLGNDIFSNADGNGILDIFDRFNFTINEDAPHEREIAVDPEMLGKIFENLLEKDIRKSKGAFYTPREIVHYQSRTAKAPCFSCGDEAAQIFSCLS